MKAPLTLITIPVTMSFLSGFFGWYLDDGMYILFGLLMVIGLVWAWMVEMKKDK